MVKGTTTLSLLSAVGATLCCLAPLFALFSGLSGATSSLSWLEPVRPYLIGVSVLLLGYAWYGKLRAKKETCCDVPKRPSFVQSTTFLAFVTALAVVVMAFPLYARVFYKNGAPFTASNAKQTAPIKNVEFFVTGMGCADCEPAVESEVAALTGVKYVKASCKKKNTVVSFDSSQTSIQTISNAINSTGYTVRGIKN